MTHGDFKDLTIKTASDKILHDKAFNIAKNPKHDGYKRGLVSMVYKIFDKNTSGSGNRNENISNKEIKYLILKIKKNEAKIPDISNLATNASLNA